MEAEKSEYEKERDQIIARNISVQKALVRCISSAILLLLASQPLTSRLPPPCMRASCMQLGDSLSEVAAKRREQDAGRATGRAPTLSAPSGPRRWVDLSSMHPDVLPCDMHWPGRSWESFCAQILQPEGCRRGDPEAEGSADSGCAAAQDYSVQGYPVSHCHLIPCATVSPFVFHCYIHRSGWDGWRLRRLRPERRGRQCC